MNTHYLDVNYQFRTKFRLAWRYKWVNEYGRCKVSIKGFLSSQLERYTISINGSQVGIP
jgi:hypothetical protein